MAYEEIRTGTVAIANGGTGATTAANAISNLGAQAKHTTVSATLTANGWSSKTQTISVSGVTASNTIIVGAAPNSVNIYSNSGITCTSQASGTLTFTCNITPTSAITINVIILN